MDTSRLGELSSVKFLKIQLRNEVKTVELLLDQDNKAKLKSNNDILLLKFYIQMLQRERIQQKKQNQRAAEDESAPLATYDLNKTSNTESQSLLPIDSGMKPSSLNNTMERGRDINQEKMLREELENAEEGELLLDEYDSNRPAGLKILIHGIEAWVKNSVDYELLLGFIRDWELHNTNFLTQISNDYIDCDETHEQTGERKIKKRKKRMPGDFNFGDEVEEYISVSEHGCDFDGMIKKNIEAKKKNKLNDVVDSVVKESPKIVNAYMKKLLCCW